MIKLRDNQGNTVATIHDNSEMSFDEKRIEEEYNKAAKQLDDKKSK